MRALRQKVQVEDRNVAIKQYDKAKLAQEPQRREALKREIQTMNQLNHEGIMKFYDTIDHGNKVSLVVEYINGNNLYQFIRKLPESRIKDE